jgi:hypothetical protein
MNSRTIIWLRWGVAVLLLVVWGAFIHRLVQGENVGESLFWAAIATLCLTGVDFGARKLR